MCAELDKSGHLFCALEFKGQIACAPTVQEPDVHDSGSTNGVSPIVVFKKCRVRGASENSNVGDPSSLTLTYCLTPIKQ